MVAGLLLPFIAPEIDYATVDRLKLSQAVGELVRRALSALPERGGRVALRARLAGDDELLIEIADDGTGAGESPVDKTFDGRESADAHLQNAGLRLAKGVIERHGGRLEVSGERGEWTHAVLRLPLRP